MDRFVCPNGHTFPSIVAVKCEHCEAEVACQPAAIGMALDRRLQVAVKVAEDATALAERYGEAIAAISAALPDANRVRAIIAALDTAGGQ